MRYQRTCQFLNYIAMVSFFLFSTSLTHAQHNTKAPWVGETFWGAFCHGKLSGYGPFDYTLRASYPKNLSIVERSHFTPNVENLISGSTSGTPAGDLDYTLRAWPNHHRALYSVIRLRVRNKNKTTQTTGTPAECYLQRAINYSPKDGTTHMLYANLLAQMEHPQEALAAYEKALQLEPTNLIIKYNLGLLLVELGRYDDAKKYAIEVYAASFPLPGLKRKLQEKGHGDQVSP